MVVFTYIKVLVFQKILNKQISQIGGRKKSLWPMRRKKIVTILSINNAPLSIFILHKTFTMHITSEPI